MPFLKENSFFSFFSFHFCSGLVYPNVGQVPGIIPNLNKKAN